MDPLPLLILIFKHLLPSPMNIASNFVHFSFSIKKLKQWLHRKFLIFKITFFCTKSVWNKAFFGRHRHIKWCFFSVKHFKTKFLKYSDFFTLNGPEAEQFAVCKNSQITIYVGRRYLCMTLVIGVHFRKNYWYQSHSRIVSPQEYYFFKGIVHQNIMLLSYYFLGSINMYSYE